MRHRIRKGDFLEVSLLARNQGEATSILLKEIFCQLGMDELSLTESCDGFFVKVSTFFSSAQEANKIIERVRRLRLKNIKAQIKFLAKKDWYEKWKVEFYPFFITKRIKVVPYWQRNKMKKLSGGRQLIYLKSVNAFGTGMHETTRFMANLIERCGGHFQSFIDIGTGTGILGLVALKNGAKDVILVDVKREALKAARENFCINGMSCKKYIKGDVYNLKMHGQFDFVAANLISHELIRVKKKLIRLVKKRRYLAISGISLENLPLVHEAFKEFPLRCLKIERGKDWGAILYKRIK